MATHSSRTTTDHDEIRQWAERRNAQPARVKRTGSANAAKDPGIIRLDLPGYSGRDSLEPITWDEWFDAFDENNLALVYQDRTAGGKRSNFNKLVGRETAKARAEGDSHASRHRGRKTTGTRRSSASSGRTGGSASKRTNRKTTTTAKRASGKRTAPKSGSRRGTSSRSGSATRARASGSRRTS